MSGCRRRRLSRRTWHRSGRDDQPDTILDLAKDASRQAAAKLRVLRIGKQEQAQEEYQNAQDEVRVQEKIYAELSQQPYPRGARYWSCTGLILVGLTLSRFHVKHLPLSNPLRLILCIFRPLRQMARAGREPRRSALST